MIALLQPWMRQTSSTIQPMEIYPFGDYVMVMPYTTEKFIGLEHVWLQWLGKALTCTEYNMEHIMYGEFKVEWWEHVAPL